MALGELSADDSGFFKNQFHLVNKHRKYGDVFKTWWIGNITTCIVGHAAGRRFPAKNKDNMRVATIDVMWLFPLGYLRAPEGDEHKIIDRTLSQFYEGDGHRGSD